MNHASSSPLDAEAYRYLKHHQFLERARDGAYQHLNQIWLQLNRLITRELGGALRQNNWLEVISPEPNMITGLRWSTMSISGGVTLEVADVRRWTNVSGERVVFTISSPHAQTRTQLRDALSPKSLDQAFKLGDALSHSVLSYSAESSRVISLSLPLMLGEPRYEAGALLESIAIFWELMEGREVQSEPSPQESPPLSSGLPSTTTKVTPTPAPRYVSAAPPPRAASQRASSPSHPAPRQDHQSAPPFPPTLPPSPLASVEPLESASYEDQRILERLETTPPASLINPIAPSPSRHPESAPVAPDPSSSLERAEHLSKEEMIQLVQAQARQRSGRLIRGGERNAPPVLSEPPRFVPRPLSEQEARAQPVPSKPVAVTSERSMIDDGRVHSPSVEAEAISLTEEPVIQERITLPQASTPTSVEPQPLQVKLAESSDATFEASADEVSPPSYIKSLSESPESETEQPNAPEERSASPMAKLTLESLTELLERISLAPWRINTYDEGRGQILWLQNGAHLDYNPAGELILGGENQEDTRGRLGLVGIEV